MTRTTPLRRISLHLSHMRRTLDRTFMTPRAVKFGTSGVCPAPGAGKPFYGNHPDGNAVPHPFTVGNVRVIRFSGPSFRCLSFGE